MRLTLLRLMIVEVGVQLPLLSFVDLVDFVANFGW